MTKKIERLTQRISASSSSQMTADYPSPKLAQDRSRKVDERRVENLYVTEAPEEHEAEMTENS